MKDKVVVADKSTWKVIFQVRIHRLFNILQFNMSLLKHDCTLIIQRDASASAYYYRDEPEFCLLASLFGLFDVKDEFPHEVITLSDNTEVIVLSDSLVPNAPIRGMRYDSPTDSAEVTSPMPGPSTRVCRKLFDVHCGALAQSLVKQSRNGKVQACRGSHHHGYCEFLFCRFLVLLLSFLCGN